MKTVNFRWALLIVSLVSVLVMVSLFHRLCCCFSGKARPSVSRPSPYGLPVADVPHVSLNQEDYRGKRVFMVGDVHGCHDELLTLLERADALQPDVQVVFVGDLINKGPKNVECVELARRIGALAVRGNHDEVALSVLAGARQSGTAVPQRMAWLNDLGADNEKWLLDLPYTIHIPWLNALVVHAGLVPGVALTQQDPDNLIHMRNLIWDEARGVYMATRKTAEGAAWAPLWRGPLHLYFGHDARRGVQTERYATGLDSGCVYGRSLSGMYVDTNHTGEIISVAAKETYKKP